MRKNTSLRAHFSLCWNTCLATVLTIGSSFDAFAAITMDNSMGHAAQTLAGPSYLIPETLGRLSGNNLFHSFQTFNIFTGESANFTTATPTIANIISRVTGGSLSQINGLIKLTPVSGTPNFFFINPAGVTFGAGASIDIPGAFHVSTADYIKFPEGNLHADLNQESTFSSASPEAFGFLGAKRVAITIKDGATLATTMPSQPISIVAGDISINTGGVTTQGGDIRVVALGKKAQEIGFVGTMDATAVGNLSIVNGGKISSSTLSSDNAGSINVSAGSISIYGQRNGDTGIYSEAKPSSLGNAGSIDVSASGDILITNGSKISSSTFSSGDAGSIRINAGRIYIDSEGYNGGVILPDSTGDRIFPAGIISVAEGSIGNAGNIDVSVSGILSIADGGIISSSTISSGNAGNIKVSAGSINIDGYGNLFTGFDTSTFGRGQAGSIDISTSGNLFIASCGIIVSSTFTSSNGGYVKVSAGSITIDGQGRANTGIFSQANPNRTFGEHESLPSTGNAGSVDVSAAGGISIISEGTISSTAYASGNAGAVKVSADSIAIDGRGFHDFATGLFSQSANGTGNAGSIDVLATTNLSVANGGGISTSTYTSGDAGAVKVSAGSITIDGQGSFAGIVSQSVSRSSGNAGSVEVTSLGNLSIVNGGEIASSTFSSGDAGAVKVSASTLLVDGGRINALAAAGSSGQAGSVSVVAADSITLGNGGTLSIQNDAIAVSTVSLVPTTLTVAAPSITLNGGQITAATSGNVNARLVDVSAAGISITNGGVISSSTSGFGSAGSVNVSAGTLLMDGGSINALAAASSLGQTGNVIVTSTEALTLSNNSQISIANNASVANPSAITPTVITATAPCITILNSPNAITTSSTGNVAAGSINITASDKLYVGPSGITTTSNLGNGGAINIQAGMLSLVGSQIATSVTGPLNGNGGNIAINADTLILNTGFIQANTAAANASGGTVSIATQNLIASGNTLFLGGNTPYIYQPGVFGFNVIQAAAPTGLSGTIQMSTPVLDVSGSLGGLYTQVIDTGGLSRNPCQTTGGNSLAQSGRGGLPPSARGLLRAEPAWSLVKSSHLASTGADYMHVALSNCSL